MLGRVHTGPDSARRLYLTIRSSSSHLLVFRQRGPWDLDHLMLQTLLSRKFIYSQPLSLTCGMVVGAGEFVGLSEVSAWWSVISAPLTPGLCWHVSPDSMPVQYNQLLLTSQAIEEPRLFVF